MFRVPLRSDHIEGVPRYGASSVPRVPPALDADVREALERIATDEARHAELGWRFLKWAFDSLPAVVLNTVRTNMLAILERETRRDAPPLHATTAECVTWLALGVGDARFRRDVRHRALTEVIDPCSRALRFVDNPAITFEASTQGGS